MEMWRCDGDVEMIHGDVVCKIVNKLVPGCVSDVVETG